ncbi:uncharacterized protein LOC111138094 isoform X1 [Crassostrea virginica]
MHVLHICLMCCMILSCLKSGFQTSTKQKLTFYVNGLSWNDAKAVCEENGGSLLKISTSTKQYFLERYLAKEWNSMKSENIWVGLHEIDPRNGSKTQWVDCEDVSYTNFAPGSPYQVTDDRLCFSVISSSGYWSTERCDQKFGFVCEETIGTCDFDRMYARTGCNEPSPQQAELSLPDCLAKCRDIPIQPGGAECWGVGFYLGYSGADCWMFLSVDPEACLTNYFTNPNIDMYLKTCFIQDVNSKVFPVNSTSLTPNTSCMISYSELSSHGYSDPTTSATAISSTSGEYSESCLCSCGKNSSLSLEEMLAQLKLELSVDRKETSAYLRTKSCAKDDRRSAAVIGVGGLVFIVLEIGFFLLLDLPNFIGFIKLIYKRGCKK